MQTLGYNRRRRRHHSHRMVAVCAVRWVEMSRCGRMTALVQKHTGLTHVRQHDDDDSHNIPVQHHGHDKDSSCLPRPPLILAPSIVYFLVCHSPISSSQSPESTFSRSWITSEQFSPYLSQFFVSRPLCTAYRAWTAYSHAAVSESHGVRATTAAAAEATIGKVKVDHYTNHDDERMSGGIGRMDGVLAQLNWILCIPAWNQIHSPPSSAVAGRVNPFSSLGKNIFITWSVLVANPPPSVVRLVGPEDADFDIEGGDSCRHLIGGSMTAVCRRKFGHRSFTQHAAAKGSELTCGVEPGVPASGEEVEQWMVLFGI